MKTPQQLQKEKEEILEPKAEKFANELLQLFTERLDLGITWIEYRSIDNWRELPDFIDKVDKKIKPVLAKYGWKYSWSKSLNGFYLEPKKKFFSWK